ncbi:band 3 cytoplasmic domain protein, partial [Teladorsagia circumcincta]
VDFLQRHICAFVRLKTANVLGDLTEVPVPTRFIFLMLGPTGHGSQYKEIGRAIATLMADEIFHDVAYKARNKEDLLDGVDEFLDQVPHYLSDFTDALNLQCLATACFMYFALLAPIVTFGGLLEEATHQRMAAMENILG